MNISFGRAIRIESDTNPSRSNKTSKVDKTTSEVLSTMEGKKASMFDAATSRKTGAFLRAQLGDYSQTTGIFTKRINGESYLYTGKEAQKAREFTKDASQKLNAIDAKYADGAKTRMAKKAHAKERQVVISENNQKLLGMVEDGRSGKDDTVLDIISRADGNPDVDRIEYSSAHRTEDGTVRKRANLRVS